MQKMSRSNVKARKWMEANGYQDIHFFPHTRWSKDFHFQGLEFDGIASVGATLVLFQVKSNKKCPKKVLEQYKKILKTFYVKCLWFNARDHKPLQVNNKEVAFLITGAGSQINKNNSPEGLETSETAVLK